MVSYLFYSMILFASVCYADTQYKSDVVDFSKLQSSVNISAEEYWKSLVVCGKPHIVRLIGDNCKLCHATRQMYRDLARTYGRHVTFIDMDYKKNSHFLKQYKIQSLPGFLFLGRNGVVHNHKSQGRISQSSLEKAIEDYFQLHI